MQDLFLEEQNQLAKPLTHPNRPQIMGKHEVKITISGVPGSGKSTLLQEIGAQLHMLGFAVFGYDDEGTAKDIDIEFPDLNESFVERTVVHITTTEKPI